MGCLRIGSGGGLVIALILNIVAIATPGWIYTAIASQGLFVASTFGGEIVEITRGNAEKVAIAFNVIGDAFLVVGAILALIGGARKEKGKVVGLIGGIFAIIASVFILIAMATYTGLYIDTVTQTSGIDWGYSFALGWSSFGLAFIGGIVATAGN